MKSWNRHCLSVFDDACPGLLNLYPFGYWRFARELKTRSRSFVNKTITYVAVLYRTFAFLRTCFLYYNLCLCKSFKERAPKGAHQRSATPSQRRRHLICGCKGTAFPETDKTLNNFFQKKMHFSLLYIIYYIRARGGNHSHIIISLHGLPECRALLSGMISSIVLFLSVRYSAYKTPLYSIILSYFTK